jgi:hypothetical protein
MYCFAKNWTFSPFLRILSENFRESFRYFRIFSFENFREKEKKIRENFHENAKTKIFVSTLVQKISRNASCQPRFPVTACGSSRKYIIGDISSGKH